MKTLILFAILSLLLYISAQRVYFVSENGNDNNPGTETSPFKTLIKARDTIRTLNPKPTGGVQVKILPGSYYFLDGPFQLTSEDSGTSSSPITYSGQSNNVRLLGGIRLPNSKFFLSTTESPVPKESLGQVYQIDLKKLGITNYGELASGGLGQCVNNKLEVFYNSKPLMLARYPNVAANGIWQWEQIIKVDSSLSFTYNGTRPSLWVNEDDAWLHGFWMFGWSDNYIKIQSINTASKIITASSQTPPLYGFVAQARYYGVNILSELDTPGEYYLHRPTGILYLIPPVNQPIETAEVFVSIGETIISVSSASYITFENLRIEFARTLAVELSAVNQVTIKNSIISNHGGSSVSLSGVHSSVTGCTISGNGCNGINVYGGDIKSLTPSFLSITSNEIYEYARWKRTYEPGILWSGVGHYIANNYIHDAPHNGILGGGNNCIFEYNHLANLCYEVDDSGAFYTGRSWIQRGNIIRHSRFENIQMIEPVYLGSRSVQAIYFDDQMSGWEVFNSTFVNCYVGVFIGGGRRNHVHGNTFQRCGTNVHLDDRGLNWQKSSCSPGGQFQQQLESVNYQRPPYSTEYPGIANIFEDHPCVPVYNVIEDNVYCGGQFIDVSPSDISEWLDTVRNNYPKC